MSQSALVKVSPTGRYSALIVDFGGVLTTPLQDAMVVFANEVGIDLQDFVRMALGAYTGGDDELVVGFETGRISEEEFAAAFAERLSAVSGRRVDPVGLVQRIFRVNLEEDMLEAVGTVRSAGLKTALLSNSWGMGLYPKDRLDDLFDAVVISGEVGVRKPDAAIYRLTLERLGVEARACIFVDDHPGHLVPAEAQGMTTVLHSGPRTTIARLEELLGLELSSGRTEQFGERRSQR